MLIFRKTIYSFSMKTFILSFILSFTVSIFATHSQNAQTIFDDYHHRMVQLADSFPREKIYLNFDNNSYYLRDTLWFKAYVVENENKKLVPTRQSRPLYVELVDPYGHVKERQIIQLEGGEGNGQFVLDGFMLPGFYEVRAFTKWMLGFQEPYYYSRVFPIYRMETSKNSSSKVIPDYYLDPSMQVRPEQKKKFTLRFFPEGGTLVKGITSRIAFEAVSKEEGAENIKGVVCTQKGDTITTFRTLHEGMGYFMYTPDNTPAVAKVNYKNKLYTFDLPVASSSGYVMRTENMGDSLKIQIARSNDMKGDTLAVFVTQQGIPYSYQIVPLTQQLTEKVLLPTHQLPDGIVHISLLNKHKTIICDRSCFIPQRKPVSLSASKMKSIYMPFDSVRCELQLKDFIGIPRRCTLSVSVRDALRSDERTFDTTLQNYLLLTSDLRGYIHAPGYYLSDQSIRRKAELDVLLLVRGWRQYDMENWLNETNFPIYQPEPALILRGQVKSIVTKKDEKDMEVSVITRRNELWLAGKVMTDSLGRFDIPINDDSIVGTLEAVYQTRKLTKKRNRMCDIRLFRSFSPPLKEYVPQEVSLVFDDKNTIRRLAYKTDSLFLDSIKNSNLRNEFVLNTVWITAKRKSNYFNVEQSISAYYDIRSELDKLRDEGKDFYDLPDLLHTLNPYFRAYIERAEAVEDDKGITYKSLPITFINDGKVLSSRNAKLLLSQVDGIQTVLLCQGAGAFDIAHFGTPNNSESMNIYNNIQQSQKSRQFEHEGEVNSQEKDVNKHKFGSREERRRISSIDLAGTVACYIYFFPRCNPYSNYDAARGTRLSTIQGYSQPFSFYSPAYKDGELPDEDDYRRTLYWNPNLKTDKTGRAIIRCYNSNHSTPLTIQVETICNGVPKSLLIHTAKQKTE